jgi:hypothetical protein
MDTEQSFWENLKAHKAIPAGFTLALIGVGLELASFPVNNTLLTIGGWVIGAGGCYIAGRELTPMLSPPQSPEI